MVVFIRWTLGRAKERREKTFEKRSAFFYAILANYTYTLLGFDENYVVAVQQSMIE